MLVKFFRHGTGRAGGAIDYLLGYNRDREDAEVLLNGDPELTLAIIQSIDRKTKYKSGVLSFEEKAEEVSEESQKEIMQKFENTLFPNLEPDQFNILWVRHTDKNGRLELNFVIPAVELRSGKRLQPFYKRADLIRVNAFKDLVNIDYKLTDPNDPHKKRLVNSYSPSNPRPTPFDNHKRKKEDIDADENIIENPNNRDDLRDAINRRLLDLHNDRRIYDADDVAKVFKKWGLEVAKKGKTYKTIIHPKLKDSSDKHIRTRIKSEIALDSYNAQSYKTQALEQKSDNHNSEYEVIKRRIRTEKLYNDAMQIKSEYHAEQYSTEPPKPLAIVVDDIPTPQPTPTDQPTPTTDQPTPTDQRPNRPRMR